MATSRTKKEETLSSLTDKIGKMKAVVFTNYQGLTVKDVTDLRIQLRKESIDLLVAKKTLMRRALKDTGFDPAVIDSVDGAVAMAFGYADEVLPAKLLQKFAKDHESVKLQGGIVQGQFLDGKQVSALAKLPGREELIAQTVWTIKGPLSGLVNVLSGNLRSLLYVLQAIKDTRPATAG